MLAIDLAAIGISSTTMVACVATHEWHVVLCRIVAYLCVWIIVSLEDIVQSAWSSASLLFKIFIAAAAFSSLAAPLSVLLLGCGTNAIAHYIDEVSRDGVTPAVQRSLARRFVAAAAVALIAMAVTGTSDWLLFGRGNVSTSWSVVQRCSAVFNDVECVVAASGQFCVFRACTQITRVCTMRCCRQ